MTQHIGSVHYNHDPRSITFFSDDDLLLKVAAASPPQAIATALVKGMQEGKAPVMRAIGHGAVGQAVKAQILARGLAAPLGVDLLYLPAFDNVVNERGEELSTIVWRTFWR
jgi:stage V sporulation protein S